MPGFDPYVPLSTVKYGDDQPQGSSASLSPTFVLHRTVKDAVDAVVPTTRASGISMAGFKEGLIQVVPKAGAPSPNIEVLQWSNDAGAFVSFVPPKAATAPAANTPYAVEFDVNNAVIWVRVSGTMAANDIVDILVAGSRLARVL